MFHKKKADENKQELKEVSKKEVRKEEKEAKAILILNQAGKIKESTRARRQLRREAKKSVVNSNTNKISKLIRKILRAVMRHPDSDVVEILYRLHDKLKMDYTGMSDEALNWLLGAVESRGGFYPDPQVSGKDSKNAAQKFREFLSIDPSKMSTSLLITKIEAVTTAMGYRSIGAIGARPHFPETVEQKKMFQKITDTLKLVSSINRIYIDRSDDALNLEDSFEIDEKDISSASDEEDVEARYPHKFLGSSNLRSHTREGMKTWPRAADESHIETRFNTSGSAPLTLAAIEGLLSSDEKATELLKKNNNRAKVFATIVCTTFERGNFHTLAENMAGILYYLDILGKKESLPRQPYEAFLEGLNLLQSAASNINWLDEEMSLQEAIGVINPIILSMTKKVEAFFSDSPFSFPLIGDIIRGDYEQVKKRLNVGNVDVNVRDIGGRTPLSYAVQTGNIKILELLLDAKADLNRPSRIGLLPLNYALEAGRKEVIHRLLAEGANPIKGIQAQVDHLTLLLPYLEHTKRITLIEALKQRLPELIKSKENLLDVLLHFEPVQYNEVCEAMQPSLSELIPEAEILISVLRDLSPRQRALLKNETNNIISILRDQDHKLSPIQLTELLKAIPSKLKKFLCASPEFEKVLSMLEPHQRVIVFETLQEDKDRLPKLIDNQESLIQVLKHLEPIHCTIVLNAIKDRLIELLAPRGKLEFAAEELTPAQCKLVFAAIQNQLPPITSIQDLSFLITLDSIEGIKVCESKENSKILEKISNRHEIRNLLDPLSPDNRMRVFQSNVFRSQFLKILQTPEDIRQFLMFFTPEQCKIVCSKELGIGEKLETFFSNINNFFKVLTGFPLSEQRTAVFKAIDDFNTDKIKDAKVKLLSALLKFKNWNENKQAKQHVCQLLGDSLKPPFIISNEDTLDDKLREELAHKFDKIKEIYTSSGNQSHPVSPPSIPPIEKTILFPLKKEEADNIESKIPKEKSGKTENNELKNSSLFALSMKAPAPLPVSLESFMDLPSIFRSVGEGNEKKITIGSLRIEFTIDNNKAIHINCYQNEKNEAYMLTSQKTIKELADAKDNEAVLIILKDKGLSAIAISKLIENGLKEIELQPRSFGKFS